MNGAKTKNKKWRRRLTKLIVLIVVLALMTGAFYLFVLPGLAASATTTYNSYSAVVGTISNAMSFSGSVSVKNNETFTASSTGTVRQVYVAEEQAVKEGDKLMRLSNGETFKASFDGRVNEISVEEGDSVSAGASLIQVVDFSNLRVSIRVDEYDISNVYVGQACSVAVTALDLTFETALTHINRISASSGSTAYYTVTAEVAVTDDVLPGMQVTVTISEEEAVDAVILNKDALCFDQKNSAYVLMKNDQDAMEQVYVEIGVDNDNYVEITSGLSEGDVIYAEVETQASSASGLGGLLSGLMGGNNQTMPSGSDSRSQMRESMGGDMSNFSGGMGAGGNSGGFSGMPGGM